jgi:DMSO/TMAO reductase YedYZ heme-binding membrane subunit
MDAERGPPVQRQPLKHRDYEVDLDSRLGKTQVCKYPTIYTSCILACFFYVTSILHAVAATSSIISALVFLPLVSLVFLWVLFLPLHELENCVVCTIRGRYGAMGLIYSEFHSVLYCEQLAFRKRTPFCF